jgi:cob(I)alamin adenosyltransferase
MAHFARSCKGTEQLLLFLTTIRGISMEKEMAEVYCGNGRGKTTLAIGQALRASSQGKSVIIIQFLKGNERRELDFLEELDQLDIKIFRFEKMETCYDQLNEEEQAEEKRNILNGLNFARKVIATQECDFLVLDEILGLLDKHIATVDMVTELLKQKDESMHIILTGNRVDQGLLDYVDRVTTITTLERDKMPLV